MKTDKEQQLWLLSMADKQPAEEIEPDACETSEHDSMYSRAQIFAAWAAIAAVGVTTATVVSSS